MAKHWILRETLCMKFEFALQTWFELLVYFRFAALLALRALRCELNWIWLGFLVFSELFSAGKTHKLLVDRWLFFEFIWTALPMIGIIANIAYYKWVLLLLLEPLLWYFWSSLRDDLALLVLAFLLQKEVGNYTLSLWCLILSSTSRRFLLLLLLSS